MLVFGAWRRLGLKPRGDVDAVVAKVVAVDDHVAEMHAYPKDQALRLRSLYRALGHSLLELDGG